MTAGTEKVSLSGAIELEAAWSACSDLFSSLPVPEAVNREDFERELLFCLLGGYGVTFEHALSACQLLAPLQPLSSSLTDHALETRLRHELEKPQFEPTRRDGALRRYRYPAKKALLLVRARAWLTTKPDLLDDLLSLSDEPERRRLLCDCPGIGQKTASWVLRNAGLASELAIIDVHLVRALRAAGRVGSISLPRDYAVAEAAFIKWCRDLDAPPAAFDLFVWEWQRGSLSPR